MKSVAAASLLLTALSLAGCGASGRSHDDAALLTGGEPANGPAAIGRYGCGACHTIPHVKGATGLIGPPLAGIASRAYLAGRLPNSPDNMIRWIQHPQHIEKGNVMPEMGVTDADARDITAFLYTLR